MANVSQALSDLASDVQAFLTDGRLFPDSFQRGHPWTLPLVAIAIVFSSILATLLSSLFFWSRRSQKHGPREYPVVGMLPEMVRNSGRLHDWLAETLESCPTLTFSSFSPGLTDIYTASPVNVQHILREEFDKYPHGEKFQDMFRDVLGHGLVNADGKEWKEQRQAASFEFSTNSLRHLIHSSVHQELQERMFPTLDEAAAQGHVIDAQDVLLRFNFDNICSVGFGIHPGCLSPDLPHIPFASAFDNALKYSMPRVLLPTAIWKLMRLFSIGPERELAKAMALVNGFVDDVIAKRRMEMEAAKVSSSVSGSELKYSDLLSRFILLEAQKEESHSEGRHLLRDLCITFMLGGRDTSSLATTWLLWELSQHPEVEAKILEELNGIRKQRQPQDVNAPFSFEDLKDMIYLQAVINETLRLHPSIPLMAREAAANDVLPDGTVVPKGSRVNYDIYAQGRSCKVWGDDAPEFKPERWLTPEGRVKLESPYKFPAFGAGPRLCIGKEMAQIQMKAIISSVLPKYRLRVATGYCPHYGMSVTLSMKDGLPVSVQQR